LPIDLTVQQFNNAAIFYMKWSMAS